MQTTDEELVQEVIYPNPVQSVFNISLNNQAEEVSVTILDVKGSIVKSYAFNTAGMNSIQVDASELESGIYLVRLDMKGKTQTLRFVKN